MLIERSHKESKHLSYVECGVREGRTLYSVWTYLNELFASRELSAPLTLPTGQGLVIVYVKNSSLRVDYFDPGRAHTSWP